MTTLVSKILRPEDAPLGRAPAIILLDPKYAHNAGMVVRLASCFGLRQVWFTGDRVAMEAQARGRLPREERMKGYADVQVVNYDLPFEQFAPGAAVPVAVEVRKNAEPLTAFVHPPNAVYVFGPEDGSIDRSLLRHCHRFVVIPTRHCLNLATAVAAVLWDRTLKAWQAGDAGLLPTPGEFERRGFTSEHETLMFRGNGD
jgi:tRNA(Leu) C34 or U34 (ribose-2'-O)-methylase TrmL